MKTKIEKLQMILLLLIIGFWTIKCLHVVVVIWLVKKKKTINKRKPACESCGKRSIPFGKESRTYYGWMSKVIAWTVIRRRSPCWVIYKIRRWAARGITELGQCCCRTISLMTGHIMCFCIQFHICLFTFRCIIVGLHEQFGISHRATPYADYFNEMWVE
jgi:hypothetical protein